ncbi:damage-inducible protein DinB [Thalassobius sp. Cn5-15]|nr:damage-inducible protein DinB [Thalassobius sp. Cn5-15]
MARYNLWQNENLITAADTLSAAERLQDRGAFFGSINATFSHLYWGDMIWLSRFAGTPAPTTGIPQSTGFADDWQAFKTDRKAFDLRILKWAHEVTPDWFQGDLSWFSGAIGQDVTKPKTTLAMQLFNHQTHHRGQIHAMLTAAGARPQDTDLPFMPNEYLTM